MDPRLHEQVNIPQLLLAGGLVKTAREGIAALVHGRVYIERWNLGIPETTLPRWVLRGTVVHVGDRSISISEDGFRIMRRPSLELV